MWYNNHKFESLIMYVRLAYCVLIWQYSIEGEVVSADKLKGYIKPEYLNSYSEKLIEKVPQLIVLHVWLLLVIMQSCCVPIRRMVSSMPVDLVMFFHGFIWGFALWNEEGAGHKFGIMAFNVFLNLLWLL